MAGKTGRIFSTKTVSLTFSVPRRYRFGEGAKNFEHHGGTDECGVAALSKRRRNFDHIAADKIEAARGAQHLLGFVGGIASYFGRARPLGRLQK